MKRILIIFMLLFLLCGCGKKETPKKKEKVKGEQKIIQTGTLNCPSLSNIKLMINSQYFLTNDGKVYKIGNYSDGTNCKLFSDDKVIKIIYNNEYLIDENHKYYSFDYDHYSLKLDIYNGYFSFIKNNKDIIKYHCSTLVDIGDVCYYLKDDGKLYQAEMKYKNNNSYLTNIRDDVFDTNGERVLDFDGYPGYDKPFEGNILWIRTDKAFYLSKLIDDDNCTKYEDLKCEYKLVKDEDLSSIIDDIAYIHYWAYSYKENCVTYVTKDGKEYSDKLCYGG